MNGYDFSGLFHKLIFKYRITVPKTRGHINWFSEYVSLLVRIWDQSRKQLAFKIVVWSFINKQMGKKKVKPLNEN